MKSFCPLGLLLQLQPLWLLILLLLLLLPWRLCAAPLTRSYCPSLLLAEALLLMISPLGPSCCCSAWLP